MISKKKALSGDFLESDLVAVQKDEDSSPRFCVVLPDATVAHYVNTKTTSRLICTLTHVVTRKSFGKRLPMKMSKEPMEKDGTDNGLCQVLGGDQGTAQTLRRFGV